MKDFVEQLIEATEEAENEIYEEYMENLKSGRSKNQEDEFNEDDFNDSELDEKMLEIRRIVDSL